VVAAETGTTGGAGGEIGHHLAGEVEQVGSVDPGAALDDVIAVEAGQDVVASASNPPCSQDRPANPRHINHLQR
jgi:hypothetical protein